MPVASDVAIALALPAAPAGLVAWRAPVRAREKTRYSLRATLDPVNHDAAFA
jgi:hypothetical protein